MFDVSFFMNEQIETYYSSFVNGWNMLVSVRQHQQQQKHLLTLIIYKAMKHEYTEYTISKIE